MRRNGFKVVTKLKNSLQIKLVPKLKRLQFKLVPKLKHLKLNSTWGEF